MSNVDFLLNLTDVFYEPTPFLMVWWHDNDKKHNCCHLAAKDYETAEFYVLRFIEDNKINHATLYKSGIPLNKSDKYHYFRVYLPLAYYDGRKYALVKNKTLFADVIEVSCERGFAWRAIYVDPMECDYLMQIEIEKNVDRVYGRSKK